MSISRHLTRGLMALAIPLLAAGGEPSYAEGVSQGASQSKPDTGPLIDKVRAATARFQEINVAISEALVQGTRCVSGPDTGTMGVHFVLPARVAAGVLQADEPEALIYEPLPDGAWRLVGVEFIVFASVW